MQRWWTAAIALGAILHNVPGVAAQEVQKTTPSGGYLVSGTIADRAGKAIAEADVYLIVGDSVLRTVRSDTSGKFRLDQIARASVTLRVRRVGFESKDVAVEVTSADHMATIQIRLDAA